MNMHLTRYFGVSLQRMPDGDGRHWLSGVAWFPRGRRRLGYRYFSIPLQRQPVANHADDLGKLRQAIIDNTRGDLFWIGEILLSELEKESFKG